MALTRARLVAGDAKLIARARRVLVKTLRKPRALAPLLADVAEMRRLIATERRPAPDFDLKLADGGLIDLEFIAQTLLLAHAAADAGLLSPETREILARLGRAGLISPEAAAELGAAHRLFSEVTQFLRLSLRPPFDPDAAASGVQRRLAEVCSAPNLAIAKATIAEAQAQVRAWRERLLGIALS
jgi:glutamate-ammonia-ligase adenylyltransferase